MCCGRSGWATETWTVDSAAVSATAAHPSVIPRLVPQEASAMAESTLLLTLGTRVETHSVSNRRRLLEREGIDAGRYHDDELLTVRRHVSHRCGVALGFEAGVPEDVASAGIEGTKAFVNRPGDEHKPTGGGERAAPAEGAGGLVAPFPLPLPPA